MSADELRRFLKKHGLRPEDVATGTRLSTGTVYRFLRGEPVTPANAHAIAEFVASKVSPPEAKRSTG